ncbi:MAG: HEAT repeat domain-containing protein [Nostocaceae cyanobacterium]|nr:HEAT repeat domain-containing protein [Nostocaceae cyanobacterium]
MNNNPNQPKEFDGVLGGQVSPPLDGVVLGGLTGVKLRLQSTIIESRVAAVCEAINYGEAGLDLVIEALNDSNKEVQHFASKLLKKKGGVKAKQALLDYNPWIFFTTLQDWRIEDFDPEVGIINPVDTSYRLKIDWKKWISPARFPELFEIFIQDPQVNYIEALLLPLGRDISCEFCVKALVESKEQVTNLKALYIGDMYDYEYKTSNVHLSNMSPILEAYPNLEVLQVRGFGCDYDAGLSFHALRHEYLKTLIIESGYMLGCQVIDQICALELPALEYLELWLGNDELYPVWHYYEEEKYSFDDSAITNLMPIISGEVFPQLKYLGLRSSNYSDTIAKTIVKSSLINSLRVLDLSMGTLTTKGAILLLDCLRVKKLHTLNVSMNLVSKNMSKYMTKQLSQVNCEVITEPQAESAKYRYYVLTE